MNREKGFEKIGENTLLPLTNDLVFRVVYGQNTNECKEALTAVLNLILGEDAISELNYENPIILSKDISLKESIMDIRVSAKRRRLVDTEIQIKVTEEYISRTVYYLAQLIHSQLGHGADYSELGKAAVVSLLGEKLFPTSKKIHSVFSIREEEEHFPLTDIVEMHYVELPKIDLTKAPADMTPLEQYGAYLYMTGKRGSEELIGKLLRTGNEVILMTNKILEQVSQEKIMREEALSRERWRMVQSSLEHQALKKGRAEGEAKGREEGREEGRAEGEAIGRALIGAMKKKGYNPEEIAEMTGLSQEVVKNLWEAETR